MKYFQDKKIILVGAIIFSLFLTLNIVPKISAQTTNDATFTKYVALAPLDAGGGPVDTNDFSGYINTLYKISIWVAGILAVIMIVIGGIEYMGSESMFGKGAGKEKIWNAIIGLVMILSCALILNTINPQLLNININIKKATINGASGVDTWTSKYADFEKISSYKDSNGSTVTIMRDPSTGDTTTQIVSATGAYLTTERVSASGELLEEQLFDRSSNTITTKDYSTPGKITVSLKDNATMQVIDTRVLDASTNQEINFSGLYSKEIVNKTDASGNVIGTETIDTNTGKVIGGMLVNSDGSRTFTETKMNGDVIKTTYNCQTKKATDVITTASGKVTTVSSDIITCPF